jgi:hypothetical protein
MCGALTRRTRAVGTLVLARQDIVSLGWRLLGHQEIVLVVEDAWRHDIVLGQRRIREILKSPWWMITPSRVITLRCRVRTLITAVTYWWGVSPRSG